MRPRARALGKKKISANRVQCAATILCRVFASVLPGDALSVNRVRACTGAMAPWCESRLVEYCNEALLEWIMYGREAIQQ